MRCEVSGTKVRVRVYGTLRRFLPEKEKVVQVPHEDEVAISAVLKAVGIPEKEAIMVAVNGEKRDLCDSVKDGDLIEVVPPVGGG